MPNQFALDVTKIRQDARAKLDQGAVTMDNDADVQRVIDVLNDVVATEYVCYLRYKQHAIVASGIDRAQVAAEFEEHAATEMKHAEMAAERINQLNGEPNLDPATFAARSHTEYVTKVPQDLKGMLEENLVAERIVISAYQEIVRWIGEDDPTTRRMIEHILEDEEEHADDLNDLLGN